MAKAAVAREVATAWREGDASLPGHTTEVPDRPGRPVKPELLPPGQMPKRRLGSEAGRIALLHAIAHIELNAIDLAFDMIARFSGELQPAHVREFIDDWISVGDDEARHFMMIQCRLEEYGSSYGALPAHDGLWDAAMGTQDDVMARLVIAPLVLEARGLDVTPGMIQNLRSHGDDASADILQVIYEEEIGHVATGARWLKHFCKLYDFDPKERFQHFVTTRFGGKLRKPFNHDARQKAGLEENFYLSLSL
jgi:uncharacterized ferritin-like protein (DUF455 family)